MFLGGYDQAVEARPRVVRPSELRKPLEADGCVVTKGQDGGLYVFTKA